MYSQIMIEAVNDIYYELYGKIRSIHKGAKFGCFPTDNGIKILHGMYWVSPYDICDFSKNFKVVA